MCLYCSIIILCSHMIVWTMTSSRPMTWHIKTIHICTLDDIKGDSHGWYLMDIKDYLYVSEGNFSDFHGLVGSSSDSHGWWGGIIHDDIISFNVLLGEVHFVWKMKKPKGFMVEGYVIYESFYYVGEYIKQTNDVLGRVVWDNHSDEDNKWRWDTQNQKKRCTIKCKPLIFY